MHKKHNCKNKHNAFCVCEMAIDWLKQIWMFTRNGCKNKHLLLHNKSPGNQYTRTCSPLQKKFAKTKQAKQKNNELMYSNNINREHVTSLQ